MHTESFSYWRPLKFDKYVLGEVVGTFIGSSLFIIFILLMFQALRLAEFFIVHGASGYMLSKLAFFMTLSFLPTALPLAFLISVLIAFSRLSSDSELVAMKANGISAFRLSFPITFFAILVTLVAIALNVRWVPWGEAEFKKTQIKIGNTKVVTGIKEGTFTSGFFDLLVFADKVDNDQNRLYRVFIYDEREAKNPLTYVAQEAQIIPVKTDTELGAAIMFHLVNGSMHHNNLETHTYEKMEFENYLLYLKITEGSDTTLIKPHMIPQSELIEKIKHFPISTYEGREFRGEYWRRYATAFSPLIFVLLGIGFGTFRYRTAKTGAILTGFVILLIYWTLQTVGTAALLKGTLSPFVAMQIPNAVLFVAGIYGFMRAAW